jgi:hypothetical protein
MTHARRHGLALLSAATIATFASVGHAQTGPDLLLGQFGEGINAVGRAEAILINAGHTDNANGSNGGYKGQLEIYNASARFKLDIDSVIPGFTKTQPRAGFQATVLDFHSNDPAVPSSLSDISFGVGFGVAKSDKWVAGISVGVGFASNNIFNDGNGVYGKADIAFAYELNDKEKLGIVLDYNGNRTFMPDVPLPGVIYTRKISPEFTLEVGFPYSDIQWQPNDQWTLMLKFNFPDGGEANIDYKVTQNFHIYGSLAQQNEAFQWNEIGDTDRRVLFSQTRAEVGVRGVIQDKYAFTAALGYAFSTKLDVGWDSRDTDNLADLSDEPYARVGVEVKF